MKLGKVEKKSLRYSILAVIVKFFHDYIFYRKVIYNGIENIPEDTPVLIASNHQNALMDALAILFAQKKQPVFLARSDIFKNKTVAKILFFLKILPVYRIRDGKKKLKLNELIFNKTVEVLENYKPVVIFPETQHIDKRHLQKVKKGIQRIAFISEKNNNFSLNIKIIPVGIYYSSYQNFRSVLQVNFGKPISVSNYYEKIKENEVKAIISLGAEMAEKISELIIDIRDLENYEEYEALREILDKPVAEKYNLGKLNQKNKFKADKISISKLEDFAKKDATAFAKLSETTKEYSKLLKKNKLKDWVVEKSNHGLSIFIRLFLLISSFPIFIYGAVNSIITYLLPKLITNKIEDKQFVSSVVFGLGIITFPLFYIIQSIIVWIVTGHWYFALGYLVSLPITGLLAFAWSRNFVKLVSQVKFSIRKNKPGLQKLKKLRNNIINVANKVI